MDGYDLFVISGIDGSFTVYDRSIGSLLKDVPEHRLAYNRTLTFAQNIENMRKAIKNNASSCVLLGWSIGAVAALFLSDCDNVHTLISINAFYKRSDILKRRNIPCDEEVCVGDTKKQNINYVLILGAMDDKIPPEESRRIQLHLGLQDNNLFIFPKAKHDIASFPKEDLAGIIRKYL